jgi:hypothetical protein
MSQQPPPPQFSPDGLYWWDGTKWAPRTGLPAVQLQQPPPPGYYVPPPPAYGGTSSFLKPSPGLRIVLIVALALEALVTGVFSFAFIIAAVSESQDASGYILGAICIGIFVVTGLALVGVVLRTAWSRWMAIAAGILIAWTCIGLVLGIPILVTAARAPDLTPRRAT